MMIMIWTLENSVEVLPLVRVETGVHPYHAINIRIHAYIRPFQSLVTAMERFSLASVHFGSLIF